MTAKTIPCNKIYEKADAGLFIHPLSMNRDKKAGVPYNHRDDYILFIKINRGTIVASVDFRHVELKEHDAAVVIPGQVHCLESCSDDLDGWILGVTPELLPVKYSDSLIEYALHPHPIVFTPQDDSDISCLLSMFYQKCHDENTAVHLALAAVSLYLSAIHTADSPVESRYLSIAMRFNSRLSENIREEKRPSAYASQLNISGMYLNEAIKAVTGKSVSAYIRSQTVLIAKRELIYTELTPAEISERLGYIDYAYFSRMFKKETGVSPREFRKNHRLSKFSHDDAIFRDS